MPISRWLAALLVTCLALSALAPTANAQYETGLPAGLTQMTVDGQPIDASTSPTTNSATPTFAGRISTGAPSVDLAVAAAQGAPVRFTLDADAKGRFKGPPPGPLEDGDWTLYIDDAMVGTFTVAAGGAAATPSPRGGNQMLDIAQALPLPFDFGDAIPGLGFVDGRFFTIDEEAQRTAAAAGDTSKNAVNQTLQGLQAAGWQQRYDNRLAVPKADDPTLFDVQVSSFVIQYDSANSADRAFRSVTENTESVDSPTIGDASQLASIKGVAQNTQAPYRGLRLTFRQDRLLVMIVLANLNNQEPDQAVVEAAAQAAQARAAAIVAAQAPGLGALAQRLDLSDATAPPTIDEGYAVLGGALVAQYAQDAAAEQALATEFTGTTDAFVSSVAAQVDLSGGRSNRAAGQTSDATPTPGAGTPISYSVTLYAFPAETDADAWLQNVPNALAQTPPAGYDQFAAAANAPTFGDASQTYQFSRSVNGQAEQGYRVYTRVGAQIAELEFAAAPQVALAAVGELVNGQVDCLQKQKCGPAKIPALDGSDVGRGGNQQNNQNNPGSSGVEVIGGGNNNAGNAAATAEATPPSGNQKNKNQNGGQNKNKNKNKNNNGSGVETIGG
ncbi:MAG TPA: hypothetical protein VFQ80_16640 [Thermomicrobiales bacterium]|nr:hypothetical protein [Thermomicrobiales bacterium]